MRGWPPYRSPGTCRWISTLRRHREAASLMTRERIRRARRFVRTGQLMLAALAAISAAPWLAAKEPERRPAPPTYTKDVLPILQRRCQNCHRRDQVGPFSLQTYEQARKRSADIAAVAGDKSMPPWKPLAGGGPK